MLSKLLTLFYALVVCGLSIGSIYFLDAESWEIVKAGMSRGLLTFSIACVAIILAEVFYAWRYHIKPVAAFDRIESNPMACAVFMGAHVLGLCILAAAIFGTV